MAGLVGSRLRNYEFLLKPESAVAHDGVASKLSVCLYTFITS